MRYKGENASIMFRYFIENILLGRGLKKFRGSIHSENRSAVHFLGIAGLLISTANILAQEIARGQYTAAVQFYSAGRISCAVSGRPVYHSG